MSEDSEKYFDKNFDDILFQLSKGNTIENLKKGQLWMGFEQVKEWKNTFGYQFHIYSNDHPLEKKPHFHLTKMSDGIDCRFFFNGELYDCKGKDNLDKKTDKALRHMLSSPKTQLKLSELWDFKNPNYKIHILNNQ